MLKLLGSLLLMVGAAGLGFGAAAQLQARVEGLRALRSALEQMERELAFCLMPMPALLEKLSRRSGPPAELFFARCRDGLEHLGEQTMGEIWREALDEQNDFLLNTEERGIVASLGDVLGCYDGDGQREALKSAVAELSRRLARAETERDRMGRVYGTMGLGAGAMLVILLL